MIQDSDFEVFEKVSDMCKFTGKRIVKFVTNVFCCEFDNEDGSKELLNVAAANVIDNEGKFMYRVNVVFDRADVINYNGTAYGPSYALPVLYDKKGQKTQHGQRIKGEWFELFSSMTVVTRKRQFSSKTGNFEITSYYRIYSSAKSLVKINTEMNESKYQLITADICNEETKHIEQKEITFGGLHRIQFSSNIYSNAAYDNNSICIGTLFANAEIEGVKVKVSMDSQEIKTIPASRWQPYTIYRPILVNGRGNKQSVTIKNNFFDVVIDNTIISKKYVWDEELQAAVAQLFYVVTLASNSIKKAK